MITQQEMSRFVIKFFKRGYLDQRLGQAFCNEFNIDDLMLFYVDINSRNVIDYIYEKYVMKESE